MATARERHHRDELARLRRLSANQNAPEGEREAAAQKIDALLNPKCRFCEGPEHKADDAVCPVLRRFQLKAGRGMVPMASQAAEIRAALKSEADAKERAERKKDAKGRQGSFGF